MVSGHLRHWTLQLELVTLTRDTRSYSRTGLQRGAQQPHPRGPRGGHVGEKHPSSTFNPSRESVRPATHIAYTNAGRRRT